jgi:hypothetical protein
LTAKNQSTTLIVNTIIPTNKKNMNYKDAILEFVDENSTVVPVHQLFSEARDIESINQNIDNFFVHTFAGENVSGMSTYFTDSFQWEDYGNNTSQIKNFTFVQTDFGSYKGKVLVLSNAEGELQNLVRVKIIDNDPFYVNVENKTSLPDEAIIPGNYYWIKIENLFPVNPKTDDVKSLFNESFFGSEEASQLSEAQSKVDSFKTDTVGWHKKQPNSIFKSQDNSGVYVTIDTGLEHIESMSDLPKIDFAAMIAAKDHIIKKYNIILNPLHEENLVYAFKVIDKKIENRPNSTLKYLLFIPSSVLNPILEEKEESYDKEVRFNPVYFIDKIRKVALFLESLDPKVKEKNIPLDLKKESVRLMSAAFSIKNYLDKYYKSFMDDSKYEIVLTFDFESKLSALYLEGPEGRVKPPEELSQGMLVDVSWYSEDFFKGRTFHYLVNSGLMYSDMNSVGVIPRGMPWLTFLKTYTLDMPAHKLSQEDKSSSREQEAEKELEKAKAELRGVTNSNHLEKVIRRLSPEIRALTYEAKKNMFKKIQDSNMKKITSKNFGIYDIDSLFNDVLDRVSIDTIINTIKLAQNPDTAKKHFKNKFISFDISEKVKKIENTKKEFQRQLEHKRSSPEQKRTAYEDNKEIKSVAKNASKEAINHLTALAEGALIQTVKNLLQSLVESLREENEVDKAKEIGSLNIEETVSPTDLTAVLGSINSLRGVDFELPDLQIILKIISENTTPTEMLAIFEGEGNMAVIHLLDRLLKERFAMLVVLLPTLYDVEDFLMALGKNILSTINNAVAEIKIEKIEEASPLDYCSNDEEVILDYLSERFPEILSKEQIGKSEESKLALLNTLEDLQNTIDGFSGLLGNDTIDAVLDSIQDNPAVKYNMGQVVEAYLNPIIKMFVFEALNAGSSLVEMVAVPHPAFSEDELNGLLGPQGEKTQAQKNDIAAQYLATRPPSTKEELILPLREILNLLENPSKSIYTNLNYTLEAEYDEVNDMMIDNFNIIIPLDPYNLGTDQLALDKSLDNYMQIKFFGMTPPPTYEQVAKLFAEGKSNNEADKGAMPQASLEKMINNQLEELLLEHEETYRNIRTLFKVVLNSTTIIETNSTIDAVTLEDPKINMGDLINSEDIGILPQASAFGTWIDGVFKKYNAKYKTEDNTPSFNTEVYSKGLGQGEVPYTKWINDFSKHWLFAYTNRQILYRICKQVSQSDFFNVDVMKNLKLTPPSDYFISAKGEQVSAQSLNELMPSSTFKKQTADKEKLFRFYEKNTNEVLFDRTPLENAISMQAVEMFVRIYIIEYLLSTVPVQGEINTSKINKQLDNLEPIIGLMIENIKSFGKEDEFLITTLLAQYLQFRQEFSGRSEKISPLPENFNSYETDLENILSVLINEQFALVEQDFVNIIKLFDPSSSDIRLETKEFLDIIPNIDVAESSASSKNRLLKPIDDLLKETVAMGGFMLERYLKIENPPKSFEGGGGVDDVELYKMMVEDPLSSHIILLEDIRNPGSFLPVKKSEVWNNPTAVFGLKKAQLWFDTYNDKYNKYSADWQATKDNPVANKLVKNKWNDWKDDWLEKWKEGELTAAFNSEINKSAKLSEQDFYYDKGNLIGVVRRSTFKDLIKKIGFYNASLIFPLESTIKNAYSAKYELDALKSIKKDAYSVYVKAAEKASEWFYNYTTKFKTPYDMSDFYDFSLPQDEEYVFSENIWVAGNPYNIEQVFKINTFFDFLESDDVKDFYGYEIIQKAIASWALDEYIGSTEDINKLDWKTKAIEKMMKHLTTQESWDEFLLSLLNYGKSAGQPASISAFVQVFQVLIDPAGVDPELLDLLSEEYNQYSDFSSEDYEFKLSEKYKTQLIQNSGYNKLPYYRAINELDSLIKAMGPGLQFLKIMAQNTESYSDDFEPTTPNQTFLDAVQERIDSWEERLVYYNQPTIKSGAKIGGVEYEDLNFFNVMQDFYNAYDDYIEASKNYTESYYKFKSTPLGENSAGVNTQQILADIIAENETALEMAQNQVIMGPYTKYLNSIKYGIRLVYKLPSQEVFNDPLGPGGLNANQIKANFLDHFSGRSADFTHPVNYAGKAFKIKEVDLEKNQYIDDVEKYLSDLWADPFLKEDDPKSYVPVKQDTFLTIPLIEIEEEVKDYFQKNNLPVSPDSEAPPLTEVILEHFPVNYLKNKMNNSQELKVLLTEMMLYDQLATLVGTWVSAYAMKSTFSGSNSGLFSGTKHYIKAALKGLAVQREIEHSNADKTTIQSVKENAASLSNPKLETNSDFGPLKDFFGYAAIFAIKYPLKVLKGHVLASDPAIITAKKIQDAIVAAIQAGAAAVNTAANLAGSEGPDVSDAVEAASSNSALIPITLSLTPFPIGFNFVTPITPAGIAFLGTAGIQDALDKL